MYCINWNRRSFVERIINAGAAVIKMSPVSARSGDLYPRSQEIASAHPEIVLGTGEVSRSEMSNFSQGQGSQGVARRRTNSTSHKQPRGLTPRLRKRAISGWKPTIRPQFCSILQERGLSSGDTDPRIARGKNLWTPSSNFQALLADTPKFTVDSSIFSSNFSEAPLSWKSFHSWRPRNLNRQTLHSRSISIFLAPPKNLWAS